MTPTPTSGAADLPEALRVPLDSLHADAGYLCGRLLNGSLTQEQVVESIRRRIDAAKLAAITAQALSAAPAGWRELAARVMDALADAQDKTNSEYPEHVKCYPSWASHARWLRWHADMFRSGNPVGNGAGNPDVLAALAASPTPPAEQQAQPDECFPGEPKVAVPQGLIGAACSAIRNKHVGGGKVLEQLRRYSVGDRSQPLAPQQASPKAAPAQQAGEAAESVPAVERDLQDVRCECCGYMTYHREHMGCIHAARKQ